MNDVEATLRKAGDRGRTKQELVAVAGFSQRQVRRALRKLQKEGRVEMSEDRYKIRGSR
jgi:predicted transcriptional regulator